MTSFAGESGETDSPYIGKNEVKKASTFQETRLQKRVAPDYLNTLCMLTDIKNLKLLASLRTFDLSEPTDLYFSVADELKAINRPNYISRANFILEQLNGSSGKELFDTFREDWGIWNFDENIVTVDDFKRGFLWCFRDHTTSWNDNQKAKTWFLTSPEALFVRRYEFWSWDKGFDECVDVREGSYKEILLSLLEDGDYEVLSSPVFSKNEILDFIKTYPSQNGDYEIDEIIEEYIKSNPNYQT